MAAAARAPPRCLRPARARPSRGARAARAAAPIRSSLAREPAAPRQVQRVHHLAVDVELQLAVRGVADAHRLRALVAGEPRHLPFGQAPLAGDAVHDLHLVGAAGDGAQQPVAPRLRLLVVAGVHQREQRERRVAQPAEAVVPVARAAELLRQRRGRRRDDAAGRRVGQRLQRDQRAHDRVGPRRRRLRSVRAQSVPERLGAGERRRGSGGCGGGRCEAA